MVLEVALFQVGELLVRSGFDVDEVIVGFGQSADQLVEL